jgi:acetyl-CoA carboxylase biotin carboxylase subunit
MNTRLQVKHPLTEMTMGLDLVALQLQIAAGERLTVSPTPAMRGHAIECRIYAEDPIRLLPSPGTVTHLQWPTIEGVRIDAGIRDGSTVTPFYDPLLAKVIAWGETRRESIERMRAALAGIQIEGVKTNIPMLAVILRNADFVAGSFDTQFISAQNIAAQVT